MSQERNESIIKSNRIALDGYATRESQLKKTIGHMEHAGISMQSTIGTQKENARVSEAENARLRDCITLWEAVGKHRDDLKSENARLDRQCSYYRNEVDKGSDIIIKMMIKQDRLQAVVDAAENVADSLPTGGPCNSRYGEAMSKLLVLLIDNGYQAKGNK